MLGVRRRFSSGASGGIRVVDHVWELVIEHRASFGGALGYGTALNEAESPAVTRVQVLGCIMFCKTRVVRCVEFNASSPVHAPL